MARQRRSDGAAPGARNKHLALLAGMLAVGGFLRWHQPADPEAERGATSADHAASREMRSTGTPTAAAVEAARSRTTGPRGSLGPAPGQKPVTGSAIDFRAVMDQVHFAFRKQDGAWRGGHTTYAVAVERGELTLTPYHRPSGTPEVVEGSAVRLGASHVGRGGVLLAAGEGIASTNEKAQLELAKGPATERFVNGPDGVEQSWSFAQRPEGAGDLEVRAVVRTGEFLGETGGGLHFSAGALGVRYGHATWIDRLGNATAVPARWDDGAVVLTVPSSVVDGSLYPAVLDPVISPEFGMDEPVSAEATAQQTYPAVSFDGSNYLVVWQDYRSGFSSDIFGARVSEAGVVLDVAGIAICTAVATQQLYPAVAWNGTNHLVVWQDGSGTSANISGARVSSEGVLLDAAAISISAAGNEQSYPSVSSDGTSYLVVWQDYRSGSTYDIYGARVSTDGVVQDGGGIPISTAARQQTRPAVSWNGTSYMVVWQDFRSFLWDIYGARVSAAGVVQDGGGILIATEANGAHNYPAISWDGTNHLVVWQIWRAGGDDVYCKRVSAAGVVLDGPIPIAVAAGYQQYPKVAWDGTDHLVVWEDTRNGSSDVYGARVSAAGAVQDPGGFAISRAASSEGVPAVASSGTASLVVWQDYRGGSNNRIYGARLSGAGVVQDAAGIALARATNAQQSPAVSWNGTSYLVVWQDTRAGAADIYGARVSEAGVVQDAAGIAISTAANAQQHPAVAWDGTNHLVVWDDARNGNNDVYGARVSDAGVVQDAAGIAICTAANAQQYPAVAWDGTNHLVVWEDTRNGNSDIYGARVSGAGVVQDATGIAISTAANAQSAAAVSSDGTSSLVVWQDYRSGATYDIYGARVSGAGVVQDAAGIAISTAAGNQYSPAASWNGTDHLVVWDDARSGDHDIYGARVSAAGVVQDANGIAIATAPNPQAGPAVAWDGTSHLVVWMDYRSGSSYDLYGTQVSGEGVVQDTSGFLISASPFFELYPAVAASRPGRFLVVHEGFDARRTVNSVRVLAHTVAFDAPPIALDGSATLAEDTSTSMTLSATDADGDPLTWTILDPPNHGTLSGTAPNVVYTPAADFNGGDTFTFKVNDGTVDSGVATVSITVTPVNDAPAAEPQAVTVAEDGTQAITLVATDPEADALTWNVVNPPAHGALTGAAPNLTYTPAPDFNGTDAFTFRVNDGALDSSPAVVSITVTPVNDAPSAQPLSVTVAQGAAAAITLTANDPDADPLTWAIVLPPGHGTLSGTPPDLAYAPSAGFSGTDAFSFKVNDGTADSAPAVVSITVTPAPPPPPAGGCGCTTGADVFPVSALAMLLLALTPRWRSGRRPRTSGRLNRTEDR